MSLTGNISAGMSLLAAEVKALKTRVSVLEALMPAPKYYQWGATSIYGTLHGAMSDAKTQGTPDRAGYSIGEEPVSGKIYVEALIQSGDDPYDRTTGIGVGVYTSGAISTYGIGTLPTDLDMGSNVDAWFGYSDNLQIGVDQTPAHPVAPLLYRFGLCVDSAARKVWARPIYDGMPADDPWLLGGDPATGTTPTFVVTGSEPIYLAGSVRGVASAHMTLLADPKDMLADAPAGFTRGIEISRRLGVTGQLAAGGVGGDPGAGFAVVDGSGAGVWRTDGTLPPGVTIDPATGAAGGAYTTQGSYTFYATYRETATGKLAQTQQTLQVGAAAGAPTVTVTGAMADATVGDTASGSYSASGGTAPYTYSSSGTPPAGLVISPAGVRSGSLSAAATSSYRVTATDATGASGYLDEVVVVSAAAGTSTIALRASTSASGPSSQSSYAINKPAGTVAGDVIVLATSTNNIDITAAPAGFTRLPVLHGATDGQYLNVMYRVADGTEGASFSGTMPVNGYNDWAAACVVYSGVDSVTPMDDAATSVVSNNSVSGAVSVTVPAQTATVDGVMLVLLAGVDIAARGDAPSTFAAAGFTPREDVAGPGTVSDVFVADRVQATAGSTGGVDITMTTTASASRMAYLLTLQPAA